MRTPERVKSPRLGVCRPGLGKIHTEWCLDKLRYIGCALFKTLLLQTAFTDRNQYWIQKTALSEKKFARCATRHHQWEAESRWRRIPEPTHQLFTCSHLPPGKPAPLSRSSVLSQEQVCPPHSSDRGEGTSCTTTRRASALRIWKAFSQKNSVKPQETGYISNEFVHTSTVVQHLKKKTLPILTMMIWKSVHFILLGKTWWEEAKYKTPI